MIDLHTHTLLSDGELLPFELCRRAMIKGYSAIALTDHVDISNMDFVIPRIVRAVEAFTEHYDLTVIAGAEITHAPPEAIGGMVARTRELGARLVIVHGETVAEPVAPGTNRAGIEAGADIISHPGLITKEDAARAGVKGVALEITSRKGHSISNGHVCKAALDTGADLVVNTDAHGPGDLITKEFAEIVLRSAGLYGDTIDKIFAHAEKLVHKLRNLR